MTCGVKIIGMSPGTGYGDAGLQHALALDDLGLAVSWMPVVANTATPMKRQEALHFSDASRSSQLESLWQAAVQAQCFLLEVPPVQWHWHWLKALPELRAYCSVAWEVDGLPEGWTDALNHYERVFVPSAFNRETFVAGGVTTDVEVLPHIAASPAAQAQLPELGQVRDDDFVFYNIGAWTTRKALD